MTVSGLGFRVSDFEFRISGFGFWDSGSGLIIQGGSVPRRGEREVAHVDDDRVRLLHGYLAHEKQPSPPRTTIGP